MKEAKTRAGTEEFSIVYRFYTTSFTNVFYVGRSDNPFSRQSSYERDTGIFGLNLRLLALVRWVDFCYITGNDREIESYEEECYKYHKHEPSRNDIHPRKPNRSLNCPKCGK